MGLNTWYSIPRKQDEIARLVEWAEKRTEGKEIEEEPYCWGARNAIEYLLGLEDYNPACDLGPVNSAPEVMDKIKKRREVADTCVIGEIIRRNEMVLCEEIGRLKTILEDLSQIIHSLVVKMQAALIETAHNGAASGMIWIFNALAGLGQLPDEDYERYGNANDYYKAHKANPLAKKEGSK